MLWITNPKDLIFKDLAVFYFYKQFLLENKRNFALISIIEKQFPDIKFFAIDIESFDKYQIVYQLTSVPTFIFVNEKKKEINRIENIISLVDFSKILGEICQTHLIL